MCGKISNIVSSYINYNQTACLLVDSMFELTTNSIWLDLLLCKITENYSVVHNYVRQYMHVLIWHNLPQYFVVTDALQ